jgi:hypothetical protein
MRTERINMLAGPPAHVGDRKIVHSWRGTEPGRTRPPAGRLRARLRLPRRIGRATEGGGGEGGGGAGGSGEGGGGEGGGGEGGGGERVHAHVIVWQKTAVKVHLYQRQAA